MTETTKTRKQLLIFLLIAYGVTYVMGILTWYGSTISVEMSVFPTAQMFYPAAGVMFLKQRLQIITPSIFFTEKCRKSEKEVHRCKKKIAPCG